MWVPWIYNPKTNIFNPKIRGGWKRSFLFKRDIFSFRPLIFGSVQLFTGMDDHILHLIPNIGSFYSLKNCQFTWVTLQILLIGIKS